MNESAQVTISDAAPASDAPEAPRTEMRMADLPQILANIVAYAQGPNEALELAIKAQIEDNDGIEPKAAVAAVNHFETVLSWTEENPEQSAAICLLASYLCNGRYVMQGMAEGEDEAPAEAAPE